MQRKHPNKILSRGMAQLAIRFSMHLTGLRPSHNHRCCVLHLGLIQNTKLVLQSLDGRDTCNRSPILENLFLALLGLRV